MKISRNHLWITICAAFCLQFIVTDSSKTLEVIEKYQHIGEVKNFNEDDLTNTQATDCDCGVGECTFKDGQKTCNCPQNYAEKDGKCQVCNCGEGICSFENGNKTCECFPISALYNETCVECFCGPRGKCIFQDGKKKCMCPLNMTEKDGSCQDCFCGKGGVCRFEGEDKVCKCNEGFVLKESTGLCHKCDCGKDGICRFKGDDKVCKCNQGFVLKESTGLCHEEDAEEPHICDAGIPCLNGGRCIKKARDYKCECSNGFTGKNCTGTLLCEEKGRAVCGSVPCTYDNASNTSFCDCGNTKYFDQKEKKCKGMQSDSLKETAIIGGTLGALLLVAIIVCVALIRKNKQNSVRYDFIINRLQQWIAIQQARRNIDGNEEHGVQNQRQPDFRKMDESSENVKYAHENQTVPKSIEGNRTYIEHDDGNQRDPVENQSESDPNEDQDRHNQIRPGEDQVQENGEYLGMLYLNRNEPSKMQNDLNYGNFDSRHYSQIQNEDEVYFEDIELKTLNKKICNKNQIENYGNIGGCRPKQKKGLDGKVEGIDADIELGLGYQKQPGENQNEEFVKNKELIRPNEGKIIVHDKKIKHNLGNQRQLGEEHGGHNRRQLGEENAGHNRRRHGKKQVEENNDVENDDHSHKEPAGNQFLENFSHLKRGDPNQIRLNGTQFENTYENIEIVDNGQKQTVEKHPEDSGEHVNVDGSKQKRSDGRNVADNCEDTESHNQKELVENRIKCIDNHGKNHAVIQKRYGKQIKHSSQVTKNFEEQSASHKEKPKVVRQSEDNGRYFEGGGHNQKQSSGRQVLNKTFNIENDRYVDTNSTSIRLESDGQQVRHTIPKRLFKERDSHEHQFQRKGNQRIHTNEYQQEDNIQYLDDNKYYGQRMYSDDNGIGQQFLESMGDANDSQIKPLSNLSHEANGSERSLSFVKYKHSLG